MAFFIVHEVPGKNKCSLKEKHQKLFYYASLYSMKLSAYTKIIQLSDSHIAGPNKHPNGIDVRGNFEKIITEISSLDFDMLWLTGDLCMDMGDKNSYEWIKVKLNRLFSKPIHCIPGNHDETMLMAQVFEKQDLLKGEELYFKTKIPHYTVLSLDTAAACLSESQMAWLTQEIRNSADDILVFMHHPPILAQVFYMDANHALKDHYEILKILQSSSKRVHVFCGHFHTDKTIHAKNVSVHITPSLYVQLKSNTFKMEIDHEEVGYRLITAGKDYVNTEVRYIR